MQLHTYPLLKVEDPFGLSDADWAEISKLQRAYSLGGNESLSEALIDLLESDRVRAAGVLRAISPRAVRETIDDEMIRELEVLAGEFKVAPINVSTVLSASNIAITVDGARYRRFRPGIVAWHRQFPK